MIPKFTFDLCHLYSNWQGSVRMPHVIKCAEKLSKMTAKYKLNELNERLRIGQAYLPRWPYPRERIILLPEGSGI